MNNNNSKITKQIKKMNLRVSIGNNTSHSFLSDPARFSFSLSRYKFVAKMFEGFNEVLEVGAGDGFKSTIVGQFCKNLTLSDLELENQKEYDRTKVKKFKFILNDFTKKSLKKKYDGIYLLDVLEHISKKKENLFLTNLKKSLKTNGSIIIGMPSLESQKYASKLSKLGHINCKTKKELRKFLYRHFNNVYLFSMNDEVVHTGFDKMSHYILAIANSKKKRAT